MAKKNKYKAIISHRSGLKIQLAHLAVACGCDRLRQVQYLGRIGFANIMSFKDRRGARRKAVTRGAS